MPKSTSTFIKSKMNKDTDSRILPSGEYRDAQNVSVSKSEGSDVGALENVLGNRVLLAVVIVSFAVLVILTSNGGKLSGLHMYWAPRKFFRDSDGGWGRVLQGTLDAPLCHPRQPI